MPDWLIASLLIESALGVGGVIALCLWSLYSTLRKHAMRSATAPWEKVAKVAVDSGTLWIGDPCYVLHCESPPPDLGADYQEFVDRTFKREAQPSPGVAQFRRHPDEDGYAAGWDFLGCTVSTGYGDGVYDVEVQRNAEGRIMALRVVFGGEGTWPKDPLRLEKDLDRRPATR